MLGPTAVKTAIGLVGLLLGGRFVLRRIFEVRGPTACGADQGHFAKLRLHV